eukprot:4357499-Pyramimonas_sp.AAC.1
MITNIASFYGSSCAISGKGARNTPDGYASQGAGCSCRASPESGGVRLEVTELRGLTKCRQLGGGVE